MKYLITLLAIASFGSIIFGYFTESEYAQKGIGLCVSGLCLVVIPLFSYYRWKDRDVKDYMLTQENLDKMRERGKN
ncbi:MAG: signal peptidase complex subunit 1 family protein [Flavobacteriaceae bacterium]|nr:signal peptidase complex subunit 1 family protein [Flavobacteriaceae bacterium]